MAVTIKKNVITVEDEELDIYIVDELKNTLMELLNKGKKKVTLDLSNVERITTPAAQVIVSAKKSFDHIEIANARESIYLDLQKIGVEL